MQQALQQLIDQAWENRAQLSPASAEPQVRAALQWIDTYGDLLGTGYLWYQTRNPETGLALERRTAGYFDAHVRNRR